jgi:hypothetical protein
MVSQRSGVSGEPGIDDREAVAHVIDMVRFRPRVGSASVRAQTEQRSIVGLDDQHA